MIRSHGVSKIAKIPKTWLFRLFRRCVNAHTMGMPSVGVGDRSTRDGRGARLQTPSLSASASPSPLALLHYPQSNRRPAKHPPTTHIHPTHTHIHKNRKRRRIRDEQMPNENRTRKRPAGKLFKCKILYVCDRDAYRRNIQYVHNW